MRVLIADDHRDTVMTLGILLRSEGHEVWTALGGGGVAEAVRNFKPGLVLLDLEMPDRSGYDVAEELYREYGAACPVIVALSGYDLRADKADITDRFRRFMAKPYDVDQLLDLVGELDRQAKEPASEG